MTARVIGSAVVVRIGNADVFIRRGELLPDEVDQTTISHLVDVGLVEVVKDRKPISPSGRQGK